MKILLIKISSMGDIIHILPAITDATKAIPDIEFHWVVEESFQELPHWLPSVTKVIPIALRRWRKQGWWHSRREIKAFIGKLRAQAYDVVLDAQGLVKSGFITGLAKGQRLGLDHRSARESLAALFYNKTFPVIFQQHAITRGRQLMAQVLAYKLPDSEAQAEISLPETIQLPRLESAKNILFFHGTTWLTKHWPEDSWLKLADLLQKADFTVLLPWSSAEEKARAERIAAATGAQVLPALSLTELAGLLLKVTACAAVDTGLGHLAAVLGVPTVSIYGPTNPDFTGTLGRHQRHLKAQFACAPCLKAQCQLKKLTAGDAPPCFNSITVEQVYQQLLALAEVRL